MFNRTSMPVALWRQHLSQLHISAIFCLSFALPNNSIVLIKAALTGRNTPGCNAALGRPGRFARPAARRPRREGMHSAT